ncbi:MAG: MBL fold metallo-hydrolase [Microlunatus sp.]
MNVKLTFLGVGAALNSAHLKSSVMVGSRVCVDAGADPVPTIRSLGRSPDSIELILLTHLHGDHYFGSAFIIAEAMLGGRTEPLTVVGPAGTEAAIRALLSLAYPATIADVFLGKAMVSFVEIRSGEVLNFVGLDIVPFPMDHGRMEAYGYRIASEGQVIVFSGDGRITEEARGHFADADAWIINAPTEVDALPAHSSIRDYRELWEEAERRATVFVCHRTYDRPSSAHWIFPADRETVDLAEIAVD